MPKLQATTFDEMRLQGLLRGHKSLKHLRVRRHGDLLVLESGSGKNKIPHARFRRVTRQWWRLEMAAYGDQWERTPFRDTLKTLLDQLVNEFP
jgi:hypothetical protein